eukprot:gene4748-34497_t
MRDVKTLKITMGKRGPVIANLSIRGQSSRLEAQLSKKISDKVQGYQKYQLAGSNPHASSSEVCKSMASEKRILLRNCLGADQQPKKLGSGAFGVVHEGYYLGHEGDTRAIKLGHAMTEEQLLADDGLSLEIANHIVTSGQSNCMECEGWFVKSVPQPDVRDSNGRPPARLYQTWMVMEKMDKSLADHFQECKSMDMKYYLDIQKKIVTGLQQIHQAGLHHNDLKDANILINKGEGNHIQVKISDLGGTPGYMGICTAMEPEGEVDSKERDVFSWGKTTTEHGSLPFVKHLSVSEQVTMRAIIILVSDTIAESPEERPTTAQILQLLDMIAKAHSEMTLPRTRESSWDAPVDILGTSESSQDAPADILGTSKSSQDALVDILGTSKSSQDAPVDILGTSESSQDAPVDILSTSESSQDAPVDILGTSESSQDAPVDILGTSESSQDAPVDVIGTSESSQDAPVDILGTSESSQDAPVDVIGTSESSQDAHVDILGTSESSQDAPVDLVTLGKPTPWAPVSSTSGLVSWRSKFKRSRDESIGGPPAKRGCFMTAFRTGRPFDIYLPQRRRDEFPEGSPAMSAMLGFPSGTQTEGDSPPIDSYLPQKPRCKRSRDEQPGPLPNERG